MYSYRLERYIGMEGHEIKAILGKNIKFIRNQRMYSQALLAEKAEISITFLSTIERGLKYPKPTVLAQIADSLGVEVYELFKSDSTLNIKPVTIGNDSKKILDRLSKLITRKVNIAINKAIQSAFKDFIK